MYVSIISCGIAKVDQDVAYVAMVVHVCCKRLFLIFHLFFVRVCCKWLRRMSQVFMCILLYVTSVASGCFKSGLGCCTCCNDVSTVCFICFRRMLQIFYLDVAKIDMLLHML